MVELDPATTQLMTVASEVLQGDQLAAFMAVADATKLAGHDGQIDADAISGHLRTLYGIAEQPQQPANWGQHSPTGGPPSMPGDGGRAEAARRQGRPPPDGIATSAPASSGNVGRAEAQRRLKNRGIQR